jgi:predicted DNA-binding protein
MSSKEKKEVVSIRGVDKELYQQLSAFAKEVGKTVGEVINEAMAIFISLKEGLSEAGGKFVEELEKTISTYIGNIDEISVSKEDLQDIKGSIIFRNIGKLIFTDDIDNELFQKKVKRIINVNELVIPKSLSKMKVLSKSMHIKKVVVAKG